MSEEISAMIHELFITCRDKGIDILVVADDKKGNIDRAFGCTPGSVVKPLVDHLLSMLETLDKPQ